MINAIETNNHIITIDRCEVRRRRPHKGDGKSRYHQIVSRLNAGNASDGHVVFKLDVDWGRDSLESEDLRLAPLTDCAKVASTSNLQENI